VITGQHRNRRRLGSQPEELSSRRHLRCSNPEWKGSMIPRNPGPWASRTTLYSHLQFLTLAFSPERKPNTLRQLSRGAGVSQSFLRARETDVRKVDHPSTWQLTLASVSPSTRELTRYS
jgi:hypothetical protein